MHIISWCICPAIVTKATPSLLVCLLVRARRFLCIFWSTWSYILKVEKWELNWWRGKGCRSCLVQYVAWGNFQKANIAISCERDSLKGWKVRQLQFLFWAPVNIVPIEDICYLISFLSKLLNSGTKAFVFIFFLFCSRSRNLPRRWKEQRIGWKLQRGRISEIIELTQS